MAVTINGTTGISTPGMSSTGDVTLAGSGVELLNNSGRVVVGQSGSVIQVVQTQKTSVFSTSSSSYTDITGMSVAITPTSTSSKILVSFSINISSNTSGWYGSQMLLLRDAVSIALGDASGSNSRTTIDYSSNVGATANLITTVAFQWLDSPATTSSTTYKLQMRSLQGTTNYVNQSAYQNGTAAYNSMTPSTITVMEIAQ